MSKKLNVIFIGCFLYPHGFAATKRKQQFLDYIVKQGSTARVLLTFKRAKGHEINDIKGTHQGIPYKALGANVKLNILFPITFSLLILRAFKYLIIYKEKCCKNIIVAFGINIDTLLPLIFAKCIGYKIVFDIVEDFSTITDSKSIKDRIKLFILRTFPKLFRHYLASGISVISTYINEQFRHYSTPVVMVPISAENLLFKLNKTKTNNDFKLLYSGTYGEKEGLPTLIEAFAKFTQYTDRAKLIMTGNCPDHIVKQLTKQLGNLDKVRLTGRLEECAYYQILKDADVLLMTRTNSKFANAGFPYKLGEYLATANPVICSDTSDVSLYLRHMESSIIFPPDDFKALYEAMCYLWNHPEKCIAIGNSGRRVCHTFFNPKKNSKNFYQLLESV